MNKRLYRITTNINLLAKYSLLLGFTLLFTDNCFARQNHSLKTKSIDHNQSKNQDLEEFRIYCGDGPEDFAFDDSNPHKKRIIISCAKRRGKKDKGGIWHFNLDSHEKQAKEFTYKNYDADKLHPHGISLSKLGEDLLLYVISHEKKEHKIVIFRVFESELEHLETLSSNDYPILKRPNDVFVNEKGDIYFSNHGAFGAHYIFKSKAGYIGFISRDRKVSKKIVDKLNFPNGVLIAKDRLFVTTSASNQLFQYEMDSPDHVIIDSKKKLAKIKSGDNIMLCENRLIIANHPNTLKFMNHVIFKGKSPSAVCAYDLDTEKIQQIFYSKGKTISGSSTALIDEGFLYVAQIFENFIVRIPLSIGGDTPVFP